MLARFAMALVGLLLAAGLVSAPPVPAQASPSYQGSVTGTVVDADGDPVPGVNVRWVSTGSLTRNVVNNTVYTDADGRYTVALNYGQPTPISLFFTSDTGQFPSEFWGGTPLIEEAQLFSIGGGVDVVLPPFELSPAGSISGAVLTAEGAAPQSFGVSVWAWSESLGLWRGLEYVEFERVGENYQLRNIPPGLYRACVGASGPLKYAPQCLGDAPSPGLSLELTVAGDDVPGVDFEVYEGGALEVSVSAMAGGVINWSSVEAYRQDADSGEWRYAGQQRRLADGSVRFEGLRFENHRVEVSASDFNWEFYPNVGSIDEAADIPLVAGEPAPRLEARLYRRVHSGSTSTSLNLSAPTARAGLLAGSSATATVAAPQAGTAPEGVLDLLVGDTVVGSTTLPNTGNTLTVALPAGLAPGQHPVTARFTAEPTERFFVSSETAATTFTVLPPFQFTTLPKPAVSGTAKVGSTLTATAGTWKPAPPTLTYQWFRDGTAIPGATARTYRLVAADAGHPVTVRAIAAKPGYTTRYRTSAPTPLVTGKPLTLGTPKITGSVHVGRALTVSPGPWSPAPVTLSYRWKRNGVSIPGATGNTYLPTKADAGAGITVTVTGTKTGYTTASRTTAAVRVPLGLTSTPTPTVSGRAAAGSTLTASPGPWGPGTVSLSYVWKRDGAMIAGASARTYRLTAADAGKSVTVTVTGRRTGYTTVSKTSTPRLIAAAP
jgi:hypothetical protein